MSRWQFVNEYHFGSFSGKTLEMMRREFDFHLNFTSYGTRRLLFRLPAGLPWDDETFDSFAAIRDIRWIADEEGTGGILEFYPEADAGTYAEPLLRLEQLTNQLVGVRDLLVLLVAGDLRSLYLLWLGCGWEDEEVEPPLPAGLDRLPAPRDALSEFYEIDDGLVAAAAERSPPLPKEYQQQRQLSRWIKKQPVGQLRELVERLLSSDGVSARAAAIARVRAETALPAWPTAAPQRTLGELRAAAKGIRQDREQRAEREREAARRERLASLAANPDAVFEQVRQLADRRSTDNYQKAAEELAELREALGPQEGPRRVAKVVKEYPDASIRLSPSSDCVRRLQNARRLS